MVESAGAEDGLSVSRWLARLLEGMRRGEAGYDPPWSRIWPANRASWTGSMVASRRATNCMTAPVLVDTPSNGSFYVTFSAVGVSLPVKVASSPGRADMVVFHSCEMFVLDFMSVAAAAMARMREQGCGDVPGRTGVTCRAVSGQMSGPNSPLDSEEGGRFIRSSAKPWAEQHGGNCIASALQV